VGEVGAVTAGAEALGNRVVEEARTSCLGVPRSCLRFGGNSREEADTLGGDGDSCQYLPIALNGQRNCHSRASWVVDDVVAGEVVVVKDPNEGATIPDAVGVAEEQEVVAAVHGADS
jgi:hypothetical protein